MTVFINRERELSFLNNEYKSNRASFVVIYGRRRVGKTALIREFVKDKSALYFMASEEPEVQNLSNFRNLVADYIEFPELAQTDIPWDGLFNRIGDYNKDERKLIIIDEFQYIGKSNKAFPSILQRIWDMDLQFKNVMIILCGSLINMMVSQTLSYSSPLYGRRTGQIRMKQLLFKHYAEFFESKSNVELMEYYAVTGGVPKYIELFKDSEDIYSAIEQNILGYESFLYEEPIFLLDQEVSEVGTYFSIIKTIAAGNHKLGKIAGVMEVNQSSLTKYLKTLIELDLVERIVPITESNPEKSKKGLYYIKDNFVEFWFKFIYPNRSYIEIGNTDYVMSKIKQNFIDNHVAFIFEDICKEYMLTLGGQEYFNFHIEKLGKWWDGNNEIDIVGLNDESKDILFGECKYWDSKVDIDVLNALIDKAESVSWNNKNRKEHFAIFSKVGFTDRLIKIASNRYNVYLINMG